MLDIIKTIIILPIGLLLAAISVGAIVFMATDCEFNCERISGNQGKCQLVEKSILSKEVNEFKIKDIKKVWLQTIEPSEEGLSTSYDVILSLKDGDSLSLISGNNGNGHDEMSNYLSKINDFLENPEQKFLKAEYNGSPMVYAVGGIFGFVGIMMCFGTLSDLLKCFKK